MGFGVVSCHSGGIGKGTLVGEGEGETVEVEVVVVVVEVRWSGV